ncbi:MAG: potassium channel family protein [Thermoleophilia bacterium]
MRVLIVGSGKTLYFLARTFSSKGYQVTIINRDRDESVQLARRLNATVVQGDGSDPEVLQDAGARNSDVVLALTSNDQDNLVICQLASMLFNVPRTVALANDPDNAEVFEELGVSSFSTTHIISSLIEQRTSLEQVINLLPLGEGLVNLTEIVLKLDSPVVGKHLKEVALPENALVAVVIRDNRPIVPRGGDQLLAGDRLVLITLPENHGPALRALTGERG